MEICTVIEMPKFFRDMMQVFFVFWLTFFRHYFFRFFFVSRFPCGTRQSSVSVGCKKRNVLKYEDRITITCTYGKIFKWEKLYLRNHKSWYRLIIAYQCDVKISSILDLLFFHKNNFEISIEGSIQSKLVRDI